MSDTIIKIENLSKIYRLGQIGTGTLSHDLNRWWAMNIRGKEDPFAKVGQTNDRTAKAEKGEMVAALQDINLEVSQGEVLGIIGKNGAGKSTLLKILSRVTSPTTGSIKVKGRMASLLEVGTGFHPEMTGRENIYMNGTIMGMRKWEIDKKLDEIVEFAGVAKYLDTPTKRYSSGMTVRLGFAIAAHLEPEILIVDEVLAVGDAEFQKKAIGKMQDVSQNDGRTVLFVSHNMASVISLCKSGILLKNGQKYYSGEINNVVQEYLRYNQSDNKTTILESKNRTGSKNVFFTDFYIENEIGQKIDKVMTGDDITLVFCIKINKSQPQKVNLGFSLHDVYGDILAVLYSNFQNYSFTGLTEGNNIIKCKLSDIPFAEGRIQVKGRIEENGEEADWFKEPLGFIDIEMGDYYKTGQIGFNGKTKYLIKGQWQG
jgi:lipopolysaccharide transport system ATP-binding protein